MTYGPIEITSGAQLRKLLKEGPEHGDVLQRPRVGGIAPEGSGTAAAPPSTASTTVPSNKMISFRVPSDELEEIERAATISGKTRSGFMREVVLRVARGINAR